MDPNTTLQEALDAAAAVLAAIDAGETPEPGDAEIVANRLVCLDGWMRAGGFMPDAWRAAVSQAVVEARAPLARALLATEARVRAEVEAEMAGGPSVLRDALDEAARGVPERREP